jgi:peptide/nickel transport system substrate-binding protein
MKQIRRCPYLLLLVALVFGCSQPSTPGSDLTDLAPSRGGTVVIGVVADLGSFNPYLDDSAFGDNFLRLLYPSLLVENADYREGPPTFQPNLAKSWTWSENHLEVTFQLEESATWSDGVPVTSEDVLFSWQVQTDETLGWPGIYVKDAIEKVEAVDSHTVRITFNRLYPYQLMDANEGMIIPAHAWADIPIERWEDTNWVERALSAGPFQLARHVPQQEIVLERNTKYWKPDLPYLDHVVWRIIPDQASEVTQLHSGDLDFVATLPPREAARIAASPSIRLVNNPDRGYGYIGWNNQNHLFKDPKIRRAMSLAIDRETILESVFRGYVQQSFGPVLSDMWAFNDELKPTPFDPEGARALLAEVGWNDSDGDGLLDKAGEVLGFELMTNSESQDRRDIAMLVRDQLKRTGVEVRLRFVDWGTMGSMQESGRFDAYVASWIESTFIDLQDVWHTAVEGEPTNNFIRYSNPTVDALILDMNDLSDFEKQKPIVDRIQSLVVADHPYTFLYERRRLAGLSSRVHGAVINEVSPYYNLEHWFVADSATHE